jgi:hypothetical protein
LKERNMPTAKRDATIGCPTREYPTEWTWHPADKEEDEQQQQGAEERDNQAHTVTPNLYYASGQ